MAIPSQTQRALLFSFIGSVSVCGAIGIYVLLVGRFGKIEGQVLGSTAAVGGASILALAAAIPTERRRWHPVGPLGLAAVALTLLLVLGLIWDAFSGLAQPDQIMVEKTAGSASVFCIALPLVGLLSLARLNARYEWVRAITLLSLAVLAGLALIVIWNEPRNGEAIARAIGVCAILGTCGTIATPILHRISIMRQREGIQTVELLLSLTCPRCGRTQSRPAGRSKCAGCGLGFSIEIEEEHCLQCGYPLYQLTSAVCPECGAPIRVA